MTYSAIERFNDALKGEPRDHVPIFPMTMNWAMANFSDFPLSKVVHEPELIIDGIIKAKEAAGYDAFYAYADSLFIVEAFGCKVRFPETGPVNDPLPFPITSMEEIRKLRVPDAREAGRLPLMLETVRGLSAYGGGEIPVLSLLPGPFSTTCRLIDAEQVMRMLYRNRQVLEALMDKVNEFLIEYGSALIENRANIIFLTEPTASASLISPPMFRQFVLPRLQTLTSKLDVPCILHMCGDTSGLLDAMAQTGAEVLSLDQCMNLEESRKIVPKTALGGNVDPVNSLLMGTEEQIINDTLNCLRTGGTSRFILMSGCSVPPKTPVENLEIMVRTAIEYGLGPGKD
jgi:uroporphyrinogen decarboxylase